MSMLLVLAGLWPPKDTPSEWNRKLNWQPIPIESEPLDKDTLLLVRTPCPRYHEAVEEVLKSPEVESQIAPYVDMMKELTEITGLEIKTPDDLFRHGHRTPADTYPNDPYFNESFPPYGWGHLTNFGKNYMFNTGQFLRRRYEKFLGREYEPNTIYAHSTGVLLLVRTPCPRYHEAVEEVLKVPEVESQIAPYVDMMKELTEITGLEIKTPDDVQSLFSTLKAEEEYGLKLPEWTKRFFPDRLIPLTELSYIWNVQTQEMKRLKAGPFLQKLVDEWKAASEGTLKPKDRKMYLYTGHDSSIVNVLHALGVWDVQLPDYAIMGIFELVRDRPTGKYGVQLYLRNSTAEPTPLTIPGCEFFCPLEKAFGLIAPVLPINHEVQDDNKGCKFSF
uniref:Putative lysosomal & prostatic acid phosphatase n=1 Tax=Lutzomyia longipalpis TaxID=7200 RepID=A0A1B0CVJ6_LUTLO